MEVWLPTKTWNGKFQAVGNGGWSGTISVPAMMRRWPPDMRPPRLTPATRATAATFATGHPEKMTDFSFRAIHEMTVTSKAIIAAFYERPARLSYFNGCSTGGRQGMMEAQRFPDDYDGIVAGAPVYNQIHLSASQLARQVDALKDRASMLPPAKVTLLANAVVAACDASDGVKDGLVSNPGALHVRAGDARLQSRRPLDFARGRLDFGLSDDGAGGHGQSRL